MSIPFKVHFLFFMIRQNSMVFFPDLLGAVGSRNRGMLGFLAPRVSRHLSCAVSKSFLSMFYKMVVSSAQGSERPLRLKAKLLCI